MVGKSINDKSKVKELDNIKDEDLILDIGPKTINKIKKLLTTSETIHYGMVQQVILKIQILQMVVMKLQKQS